MKLYFKSGVKQHFRFMKPVERAEGLKDLDWIQSSTFESSWSAHRFMFKKINQKMFKYKLYYISFIIFP